MIKSIELRRREWKYFAQPRLEDGLAVVSIEYRRARWQQSKHPFFTKCFSHNSTPWRLPRCLRKVKKIF